MRMKKIAHIIGIASLACYIATAVSYFINKKLIFSFEVVYFIGICGTLFYLGYLVVLQAKKKEVRENTHLIVSALIFVGILSFVYMIAYKHHRVFDVTVNQRYSLSEQTIKILSTVDTDISIRVFLKSGQRGKEELEKMLDQYAYYSKHVSYEFVDPQERPDLAEKYAIEQFGQSIIETADRQEKVNVPSEEAITNTLLKVIQEEKKTVAFLTGHAETSLEDGDNTGYSLLKRHLELDNYDIKDLVLLREEVVDESIDCVVIASPKTELFEDEQAALKKYFYNGGSILALIDPDLVGSLNAVLSELGIDTKKTILIDSLSRIFGASPLVPVITQYIPHAITENFQVASFFPTARFVDVISPLPDGYNGYALAYTGPGSWAETDMASLSTKPEFNKDSDVPGPVPVMAVIEGEPIIEETQDKAEASSPRLIVVGDSNFVDNANIGLSGNKDLFLNIVAWLTRDETLISIRTKEMDSVPMYLTGFQQMLIFVVPVILLPLIALLCGIFVMLRLRKE
ncbi:GldG family protein [Candidatus Omnitrophota bacterium]